MRSVRYSAPKLQAGKTYTVWVRALAGGPGGPFCGPSCTITIVPPGSGLVQEPLMQADADQLLEAAVDEAPPAARQDTVARRTWAAARTAQRPAWQRLEGTVRDGRLHLVADGRYLGHSQSLAQGMANQRTHTLQRLLDGDTATWGLDTTRQLRSGSAGALAGKGYRWGFNGMERVDEVYGSTGNGYDFGARLYDPRVGRWLSLDPLAKKYASLSPYHFAGSNPIYYVDPNGKEILPWAKLRSFLGYSWWSYAKFNSNDEGSRFSITFISMFTSNKAFEAVATQLFASTQVYEVRQGTSASNARGEFMGEWYGYKGTKSSPFAIAFNTPTDDESTVFEEFFHAGQYDYYGDRAESLNPLQIEVEAKAAKALSGVMGNNPSEQAFYNDPSVKKYAAQVAAGEQIDLGTAVGFRRALRTLATGVFKEYGGDSNSGPWGGRHKDALEQYDPYSSTEYLEHIFQPKEGVEVVVPAR